MNNNLSLCGSCFCMTKSTPKRFTWVCGKCGYEKTQKPKKEKEMKT